MIKRFNFKTAFLITLALGFVNGAFGLAGRELPIRYWNIKRVGKPIIETADRFIAGDITSIATDGTYIYCSFGKRHMAKVFDLNGQHVATIAFSDTGNRGGTLIVEKVDGRVMFFSVGNCYYFLNSEYIAFEQKPPSEWWKWQREDTVDPLGNRYFIRKGSVLKQAPDGTVSYFYQVPTFGRIVSFWITWQIQACIMMVAACFYGLGNRFN